MGTVYVLSIILICVASISAQSSDFDTRKDEVLEGRSYVTTCNVADVPDVDVYWTRDNSTDVYQSDRTLQFANISRNDTGNYMCHYVNASDPDVNVTVETVNIDVIYPAEITQFSVTPVIAMENSSFTIKCDMEAHPNPIWQVRNNRTWNSLFFGHRPGLVTITQVIAKCGEDGAIVCIGHNELNHGVNVSRGQSVQIMCAPRPKPMASTDHYKMSRLGASVYFRENVIGSPLVTYKWSRGDGKPMGTVNATGGPGVAMLNISDVQISDFGNYSLTMSNTLGSYTTSFKLSPYGPPQPPTGLSVSDVTNTHARLHWTSGYDMGALMVFRVVSWTGNTSTQISPVIEGDYHDHGVGQTWTYVLAGLTNNTSYNLTVVAKCRGFTSTFSNHVLFNTTDVPPTPSPQPSGQRSSPVGIIAGSAAGGVVVLCAIAFMVYLVVRRRGSRSGHRKI